MTDEEECTNNMGVKYFKTHAIPWLSGDLAYLIGILDSRVPVAKSSAPFQRVKGLPSTRACPNDAPDKFVNL